MTDAPPPPLSESLARVCRALGYTFRDPTPLRAALTHRSHTNEHGGNTGPTTALGADNERLEFLGDAVLGMVVSEMLFARVPDAREGDLSRLRAAVVNEAALADTAARAGVGEAIRLGRGEDRGGGRARPSILADALEAVFAAVYLDGGLEAARGVVVRMLEDRVEGVLTQGTRDYKTTLQELMQGRHKITPRYEVVGTVGPDHDRVYEVETRVGDVVSARGRGRSKKEAEQAAAKLALEQVAPSEVAPELPAAVGGSGNTGEP